MCYTSYYNKTQSVKYVKFQNENLTYVLPPKVTDYCISLPLSKTRNVVLVLQARVIGVTTITLNPVAAMNTRL